MALNRELIYGALFTRLQALTSQGFVTVSRRLRHVNDVLDTEMPALFMAQGKETPSYEAGRTPIWYLRCTLYVYIKDPAGAVPGQLANSLMDAVTAVFTPDNPNVNSFTIGGLVHHCRIDGTIETDEGTLGEQMIAIIPIEMKAIG